MRKTCGIVLVGLGFWMTVGCKNKEPTAGDLQAACAAARDHGVFGGANGSGAAISCDPKQLQNLATQCAEGQPNCNIPVPDPRPEPTTNP